MGTKQRERGERKRTEEKGEKERKRKERGRDKETDERKENGIINRERRECLKRML